MVGGLAGVFVEPLADPFAGVGVALVLSCALEAGGLSGVDECVVGGLWVLWWVGLDEPEGVVGVFLWPGVDGVLFVAAPCGPVVACCCCWCCALFGEPGVGVEDVVAGLGVVGGVGGFPCAWWACDVVDVGRGCGWLRFGLWLSAAWFAVAFA